MVVLTLTPSRGNGARSFPSTGFLGLSDVTLAGVVRTKIEEDKKPIEASSLVVRIRCYESLGASSSSSSAVASSHGVGSSNYGASTSAHTATDILKGQNNGKGRVLYEQTVTVWSAERVRAAAASSSSEGDSPKHRYPPRSKGPQYALLGDFQQPWRLVIPPEAVMEGAKSTMIFKTWRIWWAVEAVISHRPSGIHGDRMVRSHQVALINHAAASSSLTPLQWMPNPQSSPTIDYLINSPTSAYGASDPVELSVRLRKSLKSEAPKRISVELRRELVYAQESSPSIIQNIKMTGPALRYPTDSSAIRAPLPSGNTQTSYNTLTPPQSIPTPDEQDETQQDSYFTMPNSVNGRFQSPVRASTMPAPTASIKEKKEDLSLATFESEVSFGSEGIWTGQVKGSMPRAKSLYHYALGESCTTSAASSRFYLIVRIHYRQRNNVVELPHRTITFTTTSAEEREKAVQQLPRIYAIQSAEAKLFGQQTDSSSDDRMSEDEREELDEETHAKRSSIRRRSEQPESFDSPRTRVKFGSEPPLSPVTSSAELARVSSPALSGASTVTQRPRTATNSRRQGASLTPHHRTARPRSSGGVSSSSASLRSAHSGSFLSTPTVDKPPLLHSTPLPHSRSSPQLGGYGEAATTGLFANFAGFTLRPPSEIAVHAEQELPPKPGVMRGRAHKKHNDGLYSYQPPVLLNIPSSASSQTYEARTASSSSSSPSPPLSHEATMSRTASSATVLEPITNNSLGVRRKSGLAAGFSFFRRGSKT